MKKFLSFEIWATLLEELNNEQFERQIKKVLEIINNKHDKELLDSFIEQNKEKIEKQNGVGFVIMSGHIYFLYELYSLFFKNQFKEILFPNNYKLIYIKNYEEHYKSFISYLENKNKIYKIKFSESVNNFKELIIFFLPFSEFALKDCISSIISYNKNFFILFS